MDLLGKAVAGVDLAEDEEDDDEPQSRAEAQADADHAYMEKLMDRVEARMEREGADEEMDYDVIYTEERERLRRELGMPPDPVLTPEQEEERSRWIEEMNEAAQEALDEMESEKWKGSVEEEGD